MAQIPKGRLVKVVVVLDIFLCSPGEMIQFDDCAYFSGGFVKNHQLGRDGGGHAASTAFAGPDPE